MSVKTMHPLKHTVYKPGCTAQFWCSPTERGGKEAGNVDRTPISVRE